MRITQIMVGRHFGGAERAFVNASLALANRGHSIQAVCHPDFIKRELLEGVPGIEVVTIPARGKYDYPSLFKLLNQVKAFRSDAIHAHLRRAAWYGGWVAHRTGVPMIAKLHNYVPVDYYRYCDMVIGTTQDLYDDFLRQGWPEDRLTLIPNFSRVPPAAAARAPDQMPVRILTYGRYVHKKGFDVMLLALKQIVDRGIDAQLTIGGSGPEEAALRDLCAELGLEDRVKIGVWIDDVAAALDESDVFVMPSRDEPFGNVQLEAMARGVPLVVTRTQGPLDLLTDELTWFADIGSADSLADAMYDLISDPARAEQKAAASLELFRTTYHEDAVIPRLEELYQRLGRA